MPKKNKAKIKRGNAKAAPKPSLPKLSASSKAYLASMLYPGTMPAKIPDEVAVATTVVTLTYDTNLVANAAGVAGIVLYLQGQPSVATETSASTDATMVFSSFGNFPGQAGYAASFSAGRPVSASLEIIPTMTSQTDSGSLTSYTGVGNSASFFDPLPSSYPGTLAMRDNVTSSVKTGAYVRYKPFDVNSQMFSGTATGFCRGLLGVHASGLSAGASFRVRIITNYECLATNDTTNYQQSSSSPVDAAGYSMVRSIMNKVSSFSDFDSVKDVLAASYGGLMVATGSRDVIGLVDRLLEQYARLQRELR